MIDGPKQYYWPKEYLYWPRLFFPTYGKNIVVKPVKPQYLAYTTFPYSLEDKIIQIPNSILNIKANNINIQLVDYHEEQIILKLINKINNKNLINIKNDEYE